MHKTCVLDENKLCNECGECDYCDLNPFKICDNCGKCIDSDEEYKEIKIGKIDLSYEAAKEEEHHHHNCDCGCED